jgi:hypothetical protein
MLMRENRLLSRLMSTFYVDSNKINAMGDADHWHVRMVARHM